MKRYRFESEIRRAFSHAPVVGERVKDYDDLEQHDDLKGKPDNFPIHQNPTLTIFNEQNMVVVTSPGDLETLVREAYLLAAEKDNKAEARKIAQHEAEHGKAGHLLGAKAVYYALHVVTGGNQNASLSALTFHYDLRTIKLGLALENIYPKEPSEGDEATVRRMGYEGVQEIGRRIELYNDRVSSRQALPLPLSYQ